MPRPIDAAYLAAAIIASPLWLPRMISTGKIRTDWPARFGRGEDLPKADRRRVLLHAVSVGEVNATDLLVDQLQAGEPAIEPVIATTTDTGFA
jgi:3-deoxy-D-manno-octulosonic-acid transferase